MWDRKAVVEQSTIHAGGGTGTVLYDPIKYPVPGPIPQPSLFPLVWALTHSLTGHIALQISKFRCSFCLC